MPTPISELITQAIATQLATITTANGYEFSVADVIRPRLLGDVTPLADRLWLIENEIVRDPESDSHSGTSGLYGYILAVSVIICIAPMETGSTSIGELTQIRVADVIKAMMAGPQWSGRADDTEPIGLVSIDHEAEPNYALARVDFDIRFRVVVDDPYTGTAF